VLTEHGTHDAELLAETHIIYLESYRNFPADGVKSNLPNMAVCDGFVRKTFTNLEIFLQKVRIWL
jgi:hypothetical protein